MTEAEAVWASTAVDHNLTQAFAPPKALFNEGARHALADLQTLTYQLIGSASIQERNLTEAIRSQGHRIAIDVARWKDVSQVARRSRAVVRGPIAPFETQGAIEGAPIQLADGTIVVGSRDHCVYFLNEDSTLKAKFPTGGAISQAPLELSDGTVVVASQDQGIYFLTPGGILKSRFPAESWACTGSLQLPDHTVVLACGFQILFLNSDGTLKHRIRTEQFLTTPVSRLPDGTLTVGDDSGLHFFDPDHLQDGTTRRVHANTSVATPTLTHDGQLVLFSQSDNDLHAEILNSDGSVAQMFSIPAAAATRPLQLDDGTWVYGANDKSIYFISAEGTLKARHPTGRSGFSPPVQRSDGTIVIGSYDHFLYLFSAQGELKSKFWLRNLIQAPILQLRDDTVVAGTHGGTLHFFSPEKLEGTEQ